MQIVCFIRDRFRWQEIATLPKLPKLHKSI